MIYGPIPVREAIAFVEDSLARVGGQPYVELHVRGTLAALVTMAGDVVQGRTMSAEVTARLREREMPWAEASFGQLTGTIELLAGDPGSAARGLIAAYELNERFGE